MREKSRELQFQIDAADNAIKTLRLQNSFSLQSPTGSGKTFITSLIIQKMLQDPILSAKNIAFVFVAPSVGKLDHQGYSKISDYLTKGWISGFSTTYIGTGDKTSKGQYLQNIDKFNQNHVYFVGWSLFGKNSNLTNIDSEKNNLFRVVENTKNAGTEIVLIIDEAHREVMTNSETKNAAIRSINPYKTIKVSATLDKEEIDYQVTLEQVRSESAIKKTVEVSFGASDSLMSLDSEDEIMQVIKSAKQKQDEVKKAYFSKNISMVPLILIQIPDKQKVDNIDTDDYYLPRVKKALDELGYKEGFNYALWLSEDKTTKIKEEITANDSQFEVLIFKQAIATGWDVPRANILVRIREPKSPKFDIQTLGRILRNPFFKYYNNKLIDNAFVFTRDKNYADKILKEDFTTNAKSIVSIDLSEKGRKSDFNIKSLIFNKDIDMNLVIEKSLNEFEEKFIDKLIHEINTKHPDDHSFRDNFSVAAEMSQDAQLLRAKASQSTVQSFNFNSSQDLFTIYLKYKAVIGANKSLNEFLDAIANLLSKKYNITKKNYYKYVQSFINSSVYDEETLNELSVRLIDKTIGELSSKEYVDYNLSIQMDYDEKFIKRKWDEFNSYEMNLVKDGLDSDVEKIFLKEVIAQMSYYAETKEIHWFRNNVDDKSYFIQFINSIGKIASFYPDFIFINDELKKAFVVDTKGRGSNDIDRQSKMKFMTAWNEQEFLSGTYKVEFFKATYTGEEFELIGFDKEVLSQREFIHLVAGKR